MLTITYLEGARAFSKADLKGSPFHPIFAQSFTEPTERDFTIENLEWSRIEDGELTLFGVVGSNLGRELASGDLLFQDAVISRWELGSASRDVMRFDFDPGIRRDGDAANPGAFPAPIFTVFDEDGAKIIGNARENYLAGRGAGDRLIGRGDDDQLAGFGGSDRLYGGSGGDRLAAGNGADTLRGGDGRDALFGGDGRDRLLAETGRDTLTGGDGADAFEFRSVSETGRGLRHDLIRDFGQGRDKIDLTGIAADELSGDFAFIAGAGFSGAAGELRFAGGRLSGDLDGDGDAELRIVFSQGTEVTEADLLL